MATRQAGRGAAPAQTSEDEPRPCSPCRGTGKLLSGAGGTQHEVVCPWCDGTGTTIPGRDAQEHPAERPPS